MARKPKPGGTSTRMRARPLPKPNSKPHRPTAAVAPTLRGAGGGGAAVSYVGGVRSTVPRVSGSKYSGDGSVTVTYREYLFDVTGSLTFNATPVPINPGLASFNWLHRIASEYDFYRFEEFNLVYATDSSTSAGGSVHMAVDFDALDEGPTSKLEIMAYSHAVRNATWANFTYRAQAADLNAFSTNRYVRAGAVPTGADTKTYDAGTVWIGTQGQDSEATIGEIYVEYKVRFSAPHFNLKSEALSSMISEHNGFGAIPSIPMGNSTTFPTTDLTHNGFIGGGLEVMFGDSISNPTYPVGSYFCPVTPGYYYVCVAVSGVLAASSFSITSPSPYATIVSDSRMVNSTTDAVLWVTLHVKRAPTLVTLPGFYKINGAGSSIANTHIVITRGTL